MKILLINPYPSYASGTEGTVYPPLGLLYLARAASGKGHTVKVCDANKLKSGTAGVLSVIKEYAPDLAGISINIVTMKAGLELAAAIRKDHPSIILAAGGPMPSTQPEKFANYFNTVCVGEGERTFMELLASLSAGRSIKGLAGTVCIEDGRVFSGPPRGLIEDIDSLGYPAYDLLEPDLSYYSKGARVVKQIMAPLMTSRGCPYLCNYCNKSVFGPRFRKRSPANVLGEIEMLHGDFGVNQLDIMDDNFSLDTQRAETIFDMMIKTGYGFAVNCHNGVRADNLTLPLIDKMKRAGVFKAGIGIESGSDRVLKEIKKKLDKNKVAEAVKQFRKRGIIVHGYYMFGLPGDDSTSMQETIDFAVKLNTHFANFSICIPFPGTEAYDIVKKDGVFLEDVEEGVASGFFDGRVFFETDRTKKEDVAKYYKLAYKKFYFRPVKALDILLSIHSFSELLWLAGIFLSLSRSIFRRKKADA